MVDFEVGDRLIPAGAGRTAGRRRRCRPGGAHPRWRGEDHRDHDLHGVEVGSSPLARGGPEPGPTGRAGAGLIPAGAGRTPYDTPHKPPNRAHPRWRGEDTNAAHALKQDRGSSPLARGGRRRLIRRRVRLRLIPAGAGRTARCALTRVTGGLIPAGAGRTRSVIGSCGRARAHPRWRGEDTSLHVAGAIPEGSSPLARGGLKNLGTAQQDLGLIPAGAGRTTRTLANIRHHRAHPRWRGEDHDSTLMLPRELGSSPLARGGLQLCEGDDVDDGLIPAGAGRTCVKATMCTPAPAHPRWRGEDPRSSPARTVRTGSSPLARGGLLPAIQHRTGDRLIPAGAGRTRFEDE